MADSTILSRSLGSSTELVIPPLDPIFNTYTTILDRREMIPTIFFSLPPVILIDSYGEVLNRRTLIPTDSENLNMPVIDPIYNGTGFQLFRFTEDISLTADTRVLSRRLTLIPNFIATPISGDNPLTVQFTDTTTGGSVDSWEWDFGDGSVYSTEQNPEHIYTSAGTYSVTLRVYKYPGSLAVTKTDYITVYIAADFSADTTTTLINAPIQFTDESTDIADTYDWDFGDGSVHSTEQNPEHIYTSVGTYTVTLTVVLYGHTSIEVKTDYITIEKFASFTATPLSGNSPLVVQFTDTSIGVPTSWDWDFGDGSVHSTEQNPIHIYELADTYSVSLEVQNSTTYDSHTEVDYITVNISTDFYAVNKTGPADLTVSFYDATLGNPDTWDWDFGDGSTHSTEQNPTHIYSSPGNYTITLISSVGLYSGTETKVDYVTVYTATDFEGDPRKGTSTLTVQFHDLTKGNPITWYWDFGDSTYSNEQNPSHYYSRPGVYTVSLTAASSFNGDTETKTSYIIVSGIATLDIAPEPNLTMYLFNTKASVNKVGIKILFKNRD